MATVGGSLVTKSIIDMLSPALGDLKQPQLLIRWFGAVAGCTHASTGGPTAACTHIQPTPQTDTIRVVTGNNKHVP